MSLEVKKIYIDTRFKTSDSRSDADFNIKLPKRLNIGDNVVAHIDDMVIPVSWRTIDNRNSSLYMMIYYNSTTWYKTFELPSSNYTGASFTAALKVALNDVVSDLELTFDATYDFRIMSLQYQSLMI